MALHILRFGHTGHTVHIFDTFLAPVRTGDPGGRTTIGPKAFELYPDHSPPRSFWYERYDAYDQ